MMRLFASIPLALLGSLVGSALRSGLKAAEDRLDADPEAPTAEMAVNINGSFLAALAGGVTGLLFGTNAAFWTGVALGAAGIDRFDMRLLRMAGIDVDAMIARARSMAEQAQARHGGAVDDAAAETAADISSEMPAAEPA
jgi:hypothetical protein